MPSGTTQPGGPAAEPDLPDVQPAPLADVDSTTAPEGAEPGTPAITEPLADPQALGPEAVPPIQPLPEEAPGSIAAKATAASRNDGGGYAALAERTAPAPPSRLAVGLSLLALAVALGVGGAIAGGLLKPVPPAELLAANERLGDLTQRLTRAEQKLAALEDRTPLPATATTSPTATTPAATDPDLLRRLAALEARLAEPAPPPPPDPRIATLEERVAPLEQQLPPLAQRIAPLEERLAPLEEGLPGLEERVQGLATRLDAMGQPARVQDLDRVQEAMAARIAALDRTLAVQDDRLAAANQGAALARLAAAASGPAPFVAALDAAQAAFGDAAPDRVKAALAAARPAAEAGAPPLAQLRADWPATVAAIRNAQAPADLGERLTDGLGGLITIRRTDAGEAAGDPVVAAQAALEGGDLRAALDAVDTLDTAAAQAAAPWRAAAGRRLAVMDATAALQQALAASEDATPDGTGPGETGQ
ncbi:hypothetical protein [Zavarzinia sp. CC-PAN008]|uniref:hypothetical protein n=1 Tax=Zavarzinia sp. CC-PAN008 TaxID=3243332 RepID=UPI003F743BC2